MTGPKLETISDGAALEPRSFISGAPRDFLATLPPTATWMVDDAAAAAAVAAATAASPPVGDGLERLLYSRRKAFSVSERVWYELRSVTAVGWRTAHSTRREARCTSVYVRP